ncbi:endonuclease containing a URI domain [Legionella pneumophila]|nr:endonuclease containing a URI domain [Legionella pneumophila]STX91522.1 endonuclease containing a URI domain [Legionella pneumophila]
MNINMGMSPGHGCKFLVYYELIEDMISAIAREKQLKGGSRKKKLALIEKLNPYWEDLYEKLL